MYCGLNIYLYHGDGLIAGLKYRVLHIDLNILLVTYYLGLSNPTQKPQSVKPSTLNPELRLLL